LHQFFRYTLPIMGRSMEESLTPAFLAHNWRRSIVGAFNRLQLLSPWGSLLGVFIVLVAFLKANQYLYFHFNTSPAVILLPSGIAVAMVYLAGYRMAIPVVLAWLVALLTSPSHLPVPLIVLMPLAYALQATIGGYGLRYFGFIGTMGRARCALILVAASLTLPTIAASTTTLIQ